MNRHQQLRDAGRWLQKQRKRRSMSTRSLAQALDVAPQSVNNWESGKMGVSDDRAAQIAAVLGMSEIETRRGLGLWVPGHSSDSIPTNEQDTMESIYPTELSADDREIWDALPDEMPPNGRMRVISYTRFLDEERKRV